MGVSLHGAGGAGGIPLYLTAPLNAERWSSTVWRRISTSAWLEAGRTSRWHSISERLETAQAWWWSINWCGSERITSASTRMADTLCTWTVWRKRRTMYTTGLNLWMRSSLSLGLGVRCLRSQDSGYRKGKGL